MATLIHVINLMGNWFALSASAVNAFNSSQSDPYFPRHLNRSHVNMSYVNMLIWMCECQNALIWIQRHSNNVFLKYFVKWWLWEMIKTFYIFCLLVVKGLSTWIYRIRFSSWRMKTSAENSYSTIKRLQLEFDSQISNITSTNICFFVRKPTNIPLILIRLQMTLRKIMEIRLPAKLICYTCLVPLWCLRKPPKLLLI